MKYTIATLSNRAMFFIAFVSAIVLIVSGFYLVSTQYKVRMLTAEKERAERVRHELLETASQLALDRSKAALPKMVTKRAEQMGFVSATVDNTYMIEVSAKELEEMQLEVRK